VFLTSGLRTVMFPPRDPKTCGLETSTCASAARYKSSVWQGGLQEAKVVQELLRHASFKTTMDGYMQALEAPKRQAQAALADLIMRTGKVGHA